MGSRSFIRFHNYICLLLGMTSYHYNATTGKCTQRLWMQVLAVMANLCTILSLPGIFWDAIERTLLIQWNPLMTYTNYMSYSVRTLVILYTIFKRAKIDLINFKVMDKYISLKKTYLDHLPRVAAIERYMYCLFFLKYFVIIIGIGLILSEYLTYRAYEWTWMTYLVLLMILQTSAILQITIFNYFLFLWSICRSLKYVKWHIRHLMLEVGEALRHGKRWRYKMLAVDLQRILEVHWQLAELARMVNLNYGFLVFAVLTDKITTLVIQLYYGAIFTFDHRAETYLLVLGTINFFSLAFDTYQIFLMCDITVNTYYACVNKLRRTCEMNSQYTRLKRLIESFLLRVHNNDFYLDLCGLLLINKQTWILAMEHVAYESLTLVQFHMILNANKNFN